MCLLDEHSKPSLTADLKAEIESYFLVGSSRIDMIAKCVDIDNEIGGYNFDIPVLKDTVRAVSAIRERPSKELVLTHILLTKCADDCKSDNFKTDNKTLRGNVKIKPNRKFVTHDKKIKIPDISSRDSLWWP